MDHNPCSKQFETVAQLPFCFKKRGQRTDNSYHRQAEGEAQLVVEVLQPGPFGIVTNTFSAAERAQAKATIKRALAQWQERHCRR
ncbi:hypothetical protein KFL_000740200 [Klebsormidium nitens]|uniref:Uncharacterized protein n=1 Tax=Klebsormidium nitens TaxID=105231 RepID=A0A1Y1HRG4_KLENI|nr:hypothetical protein KFL_000740200 [Klebsormidium nitens]|eukprot:GAQ81220.1 hypothetical protein KFL_000740200 [Klebsormidium nitens]